MGYKKYDLDKYNLHIIKTDKFKTISVKINFKAKIKKEDMTIRRLLFQILLESSLKYPSRRLISMEIEDLYDLSLGSDNYISGRYDVASFKTTFLNEKYTESGMNKRSILFFLQFILNPNIKDDEFDELSFNTAYRIIKNDIKTFADYPDEYSLKRMFEITDKKNPYAYRGCGYMEDLKKITRKDLVSYYKKMFEEDIIDVFVIGDIKEKEILSIFQENLNRKNKNMVSESHYIKINPKKVEEKHERAKINQSRLVIGCDIKQLDSFDLQYVLNVYSFILGGSGDSLLFKKVREENSLCYSISSTYNSLIHMLIITAGIDKKDFKKTVSLIEECLDKMKKGDFSDKELDKSKIIYKNSCIKILDSPSSIISNYLSHEYYKTDLIEEKLKNIDLVTKELVVALAHKIDIKTIYILEGEENEKAI